MKLFVWEDFARSYSPGLAFAIAEEAADAQRMIVAKNNDVEPFSWGLVDIYSLDTPIAFFVYGGD